MNNIVSDYILDYKKHFEGKRITKQGFGFLGRGANVVKFLLENGASVLVTDVKSELELKESIKEVEDFIKDNNIDKSKITYRLGEHKLEDFSKENCDYVIQASGVPKDNIFLLHAKENGVKVYQESSLFVDIVREYNNNLENENKNENEYENRKIKIIGITGTRGKTTTTFLIKYILDKHLEKENTKNKLNNLNINKIDRKAYFGGNVQGIATLELLTKIKEADVIVMELDSWILQGFGDIKYSPDISVFTTFMPDHMNYYKGDMSDYFLDKANIFLNQKVGNVFVSTENIMMNMEKYMSDERLINFYALENDKFFLKESEVQDISNNFKSNLLGEHNKINVALAIKACESFGVDDDIIKEALRSFTGAPGRLEKIKTINGVDYINDTCATTGDASIAALESFKDGKIILITGGRDKELDITNYINKIIEYKNKDIIKNIFILTDSTTTGSDILIKNFNEKGFTDYDMSLNLEQAVDAARSAAEEGESKNNIILFTPAFASFGMFQNEYDRGDKFNKIVNNLF